MGSDKFKNKDFSMDMNKYLDKKSKSSSRFLNLEDTLKTSTTESIQTETEVVHIKTTTPLGHFLNKIKDFFAPEKNDEEEDVTLEDIEEVEKPEDVPEEQEMEDDEDDEEEDNEPRTSLWEKIVAFFSGSDDDEESEEDDADEYEEISEEENMKSDMKKITVFTKKVLKKLPREEFQELKHNGELEEFKTILRKHKIIK